MLDDEDSLDLLGMPKCVDRAGVEGRLVEREADLLLSSDWPAPEICRGLANSGAFPPESGLCLCAPATCNDPGWYLKRQEGLQNRRHVDEKACFIVLLNVPYVTPLRQPKLPRP